MNYPAIDTTNRTRLGRKLLTALMLASTCFAVVQTVEAGFGDTAYGYGANSASYGAYNSMFGYYAGGSDDLSTSNRGSYNTGAGYQVFAHNFNGSYNTAVGQQALFYNTDASGITALGYRALFNHTIGTGNVAVGYEALYSNSMGNFNTANGSLSLYKNTGSDNTGIGYASLYLNTTGNDNTAAGASALYYNGTGSFNVASGSGALTGNTSGSNNTALGYQALTTSTGTSGNTAVGSQALRSNSGGNNIALGANAGANLTTGSNNIDIGNKGVAGESGKIRIGTKGTQTATLIAGIYNVSEPAGTSAIKPVYINGNGQLGTAPPASSARFKEAIKPMDKSSEAILGLKPVTFHYKSDEEGTPQYGLIAEEVAKVNPDLCVRDDEGKIYTVRYEAVNAMLLNEFLKEHRQVEQLKATVRQQRGDFQTKLAQQQKQIEALTAGLQQVTAQVELSKSAPQAVATISR